MTQDPWPFHGQDYVPAPPQPYVRPEALYSWGRWGQVVLGGILIMAIGTLLTMILLLTFAKWYIGHQLNEVLNSSAAIGKTDTARYGR